MSCRELPGEQRLGDELVGKGCTRAKSRTASSCSPPTATFFSPLNSCGAITVNRLDLQVLRFRLSSARDGSRSPRSSSTTCSAS